MVNNFLIYLIGFYFSLSLVSCRPRLIKPPPPSAPVAFRLELREALSKGKKEACAVAGRHMLKSPNLVAPQLVSWNCILENQNDFDYETIKRAKKEMTLIAASGNQLAADALKSFGLPIPIEFERNKKGYMLGWESAGALLDTEEGRYLQDLNTYNVALQKRRETEHLIGEVVGNALAIGVAGLATYYASKSNNYQTVAPIDPREQFRGCCSYHLGIALDYRNQIKCALNGNILCRDGQPSPTCSCT